MERGLRVQVFVVCLLGLTLTLATPGFAQENTLALKAKTDAEFDAEDDVNTAVWLAAGGILGVGGSCLLGAVAIGGAYAYQPVPKPERLLGKPMAYVNFYTDAYKSQVRRIQVSEAAKGALGGSAVFFLLGTLKINPWANFILW